MRFFDRLRLTRYLLIGEFTVLLIGMLAMGIWLGQVIEQRLIYQEGELFARIVESVVSGLVKSDDGGEWLSEADIVRLDKVLYRTPLGERIVAFKLWSLDGRILYSTNLTQIGGQFKPTAALATASRGEMNSHRPPVKEVAHTLKGPNGVDLTETYAPVRDSSTRSIFAVSQITQRNDVLAQAIGTARLQSWLVAIGVTTVMCLLLAALIRRATRTIVAEQEKLRDNVSQLTIRLGQSEDIHERVARAAERTTALNERFLHRIAVDLHDGPGQGLALAMMRLGQLSEVCVKCRAESGAVGDSIAGEFTKLQQGLSSTLQDMRMISKGLHLPDIEELSLTDIARRVVRDYERTSGLNIRLTINRVPEDAPLPVRIALFRLLQESLSNGFRHGGTVNQTIILDASDGQLHVEVRDEGRGFDSYAAASEGHLGLKGMRERVEILGGTFFVWSAAGQGTIVRADLPVTSTLTANE